MDSGLPKAFVRKFMLELGRERKGAYINRRLNAGGNRRACGRFVRVNCILANIHEYTNIGYIFFVAWH